MADLSSHVKSNDGALILSGILVLTLGIYVLFAIKGVDTNFIQTLILQGFAAEFALLTGRRTQGTNVDIDRAHIDVGADAGQNAK